MESNEQVKTVNYRQEYSLAYLGELVFAYTNVLRDDSTNSNFGWNYISLGAIHDIKSQTFDKEPVIEVAPMMIPFQAPACDVLVVIKYFGGHKGEHYLLQETYDEFVKCWLNSKGGSFIDILDGAALSKVVESYRTTTFKRLS